MSHHQGHCPQCGQIVTPVSCRQADPPPLEILECPNCRAGIWARRRPEKTNTDTASWQRLFESFHKLMLDGRRYFQTNAGDKDQEKESGNAQ